jgi:hypothetical protein
MASCASSLRPVLPFNVQVQYVESQNAENEKVKSQNVENEKVETITDSATHGLGASRRG